MSINIDEYSGSSYRARTFVGGGHNEKALRARVDRGARCRRTGSQGPARGQPAGRIDGLDRRHRPEAVAATAGRPAHRQRDRREGNRGGAHRRRGGHHQPHSRRRVRQLPGDPAPARRSRHRLVRSRLGGRSFDGGVHRRDLLRAPRCDRLRCLRCGAHRSPERPAGNAVGEERRGRPDPCDQQAPGASRPRCERSAHARELQALRRRGIREHAHRGRRRGETVRELAQSRRLRTQYQPGRDRRRREHEERPAAGARAAGRPMVDPHRRRLHARPPRGFGAPYGRRRSVELVQDVLGERDQPGPEYRAKRRQGLPEPGQQGRAPRSGIESRSLHRHLDQLLPLARLQHPRGRGRRKPHHQSHQPERRPGRGHALLERGAAAGCARGERDQVGRGRVSLSQRHAARGYRNRGFA